MFRLALATTAACTAAGLQEWTIAVRTSTPSTAAASKPHVSAKHAVNHAYNHILGLASPQTYDRDPVNRFSAAVVPEMPVTDIFARPVVSMLYTIFDGGVPTIQGADMVVAEDDKVALTFLNSAIHRDGLAPASLEVVGADSPVSGAEVAGLALRWTEGLGFKQVAGAPRHVDADLIGAVACTSAGKAALAQLGATASARGSGSCPTYSFAGRYGTLSLDAGSVPMGQALSEAALIVLTAEHTVAGQVAMRSRDGLEQEATGPTLHRMVLSGPAKVAQTTGEGSDEHVAAQAIVQAAVARADAILRAGLPHDRIVTVVFSSASASGVTATGSKPMAFVASHPDVAGNNHPSRFLAATSSNSTGNSTGTGSSVSLEDVASYQVALWTAVLLGAVLLFTLYAMMNIEGDKRDPQLYVQLMDAGSGAAHHRRN